MTRATDNIYTGLHDLEEMGFTLHFLRLGDFFDDIVANIGLYTVLASIDSKANSISFDPVPVTLII